MWSLSDDFKWIKAHLILTAIAACLIFGAVYGVESVIAKHDEKNAQAIAAIVDAQTKQNQQFQISIKAQIDTLVQQNQVLESENQTLIAALAKRQVIENQVPIKNQNLSAVEAAKALGGTSDGDNVVLELPIARNVVTQVQLVPLLQQDKADLEKSNGLLTTEVVNAQSALDLERKAHESDNTTNAGIIKERDTTISTLKAECRKSKLKWFGIGFVAGYITGKVF